MRANLLGYTWKLDYSWAYILFTNRISIEEIAYSGRQVVLWHWDGWAPPMDYYGVCCLFESKGIPIRFQCDPSVKLTSGHFHCYLSEYKDYKEVLNSPSDYFVCIYVRNDYNMMESVKMLQYAGFDEFGLLYYDATKDFNGKTELQQSFFATINETFLSIDFLNNWNDFWNLRRLTFEGAGYWDVPFMLIYKLMRRKKDLKYCEIGSGIGTMSLSLKKVMDIDVTWINIPEEESLWSEWRRDTFQEIIEKNDIHILEGFIELEDFDNIGQFDVIVMAQVMEHLILNPVNTFIKLRKMLKESGFLFVSVPEEVKHYNVESFHEIPFPQDITMDEINRRTKINNYGHFHEYTYEEACEVFNASGLDVVAHQLSGVIHHFVLKIRK